MSVIKIIKPGVHNLSVSIRASDEEDYDDDNFSVPDFLISTWTVCENGIFFF